jgi:hypothetical protein
MVKRSNKEGLSSAETVEGRASPKGHALPDTDQASQVPYKGRLYVHGAPTARGSSIRKPLARGGCCLLVSELDRHLGIRPVSQLDTQPVVSPVNASRLPSRAETSCITRGRGGWLGLTRGRLAPPILCQLSWRTRWWVNGCSRLRLAIRTSTTMMNCVTTR